MTSCRDYQPPELGSRYDAPISLTSGRTSVTKQELVKLLSVIYMKYKTNLFVLYSSPSRTGSARPRQLKSGIGFSESADGFDWSGVLILLAT